MVQFLKAISFLLFVIQLSGCAGNKKIFQAVIKGEEAKVTQYISEKNDVNIKDDSGSSLLIYAAGHGYVLSKCY